MKKITLAFLKLILFCTSLNIFGAAPTTQATGLTIYNRTSTSLSFLWTNGNGNRRLVVCKPTANATVTPTNTVTNTYPASTTYGAGLNLGSANYVTAKLSNFFNFSSVTGLMPNTSYTIFIYEYNLGSVSGVDKYEFNTSISSANMQIATTLCDEPTTQSSNISGSVGYTNINLNWTNGSGTNSLVSIEEDTQTATSPSDGTTYTASSAYGSGSSYSTSTNFVVYNGSGTSVSVSGLKPAFGYVARIYGFNCNGGTENYLTSSYAQLYFATLNNAPTISSVSSQTVCEGSSKTVNLSGISDGSTDENQTLTITASSANTTLIPNGNISVSYSSPSSTGTLHFTPASGQSGTTTITVTVNDNSWINQTTSVTFTVTVYPKPVMTSASSKTICNANAVALTLSSSVSSSYQWIASDNSNTSGESTTMQTGNSITDVLTNNTSSAQTVSYSVTPTSGFGCTGDAQTISISIDVPTTSNAGSDVSLCTSSLNLNGNYPSPGTGTWSVVSQSTPTFTATIYSPNSENSLVGFANILTGDNIVLRWTVSSLLGACPNSSDDVTITKISCPLTSGFTTSSNNLCIKPSDSVAVVFTNNSSPGSFPPINAYTWTFNGGNPSTATGAGPHTIYYSYQNALTVYTASLTVVDNNSNQNTSSQNITLRPLPSAPGTISGLATVCQAQNGVGYSVASVLNADSYAWSFPSGVSATNPDNTASADFGTNAVSGLIKVTGINSCGTGDTSTLSITVNPLPSAAGSISGSDTVCQGQSSISFSIASVNNASSYQWTLPSGISISGAGNTETIDVGTAAQSGIISVSGLNACGTGTSSTFSITVNPLPASASTITGLNNLCQNQQDVSYTIPPVSNASSYVWTFPPGATAAIFADSASVDFDGTAVSGLITVAGVNACGTGISSSFSITVNTLPLAAGSISGPDSVCIESSGIAFSIPAIANAGAYNWTFPSGITAVNPNNTANTDFSANAVSGIISVSGTNLCGNGPVSTFSVTVNPLPDAAGSITGSNTVCQGQNAVGYYISAVNNADNYVWIYSGGGNSSSSTENGVINFSSAATNGNVIVYAQNACGNGTASQMAVSVNPLPATPAFSGNMSIATCPLADSVLFTVPVAANADYYNWILPVNAYANGSTTDDSISVGFNSLSGNDTLMVAAVNACGTSSYAYMTISPLNVPTPDICLVTVDSSSNYNEIYWDKSAYAPGDTFIVYRDTANNNYAPIGKVPYDSLSMFIDTVRTLYAANGDPNVSSWRYKIAVEDSCGQMSAMSPYHQTMFFQNATGNFSWNHYEIEGQVTPVPVLSNYSFKRDDFSNGVWNTIQTLSASSTAYTDPNYTSYQGTGSWRVQTNWTLTCNPAWRTVNPQLGLLAIINTSRSNIKNQFAGPNEITEAKNMETTLVYPNPANNILIIETSGNSNELIEIIDVEGRIIYTTKVIGTKTFISTAQIATGVYVTRVNSASGKTKSHKLIIQH